ncbi:hypothetical protein B0E45_17470 [Sinorhizobium sp. A49]|nr:hypothetical protein B0E45_17470 [Sinorhizobium sp. A49]
MTGGLRSVRAEGEPSFQAASSVAAAVPDIVRAALRAMGCTPDDAARRADEAAHNSDAFAQRSSVMDQGDLEQDHGMPAPAKARANLDRLARPVLA